MAKTIIKDTAQFESDVLNLETAEVMKKYKMGKQAVYDKRYALKKKLAAAGTAEPVSKAAVPGKKRGPKPKVKSQKQHAPIATSEVQELYAPPAIIPTSKDLKTVPVIHKPIEINFDSFSIKLNGVPKKISVNPETNAIEIDL